MEYVIHALTSITPLEFIFILVAKVAERTVSTLRLILINKGYRREGTILSFIEILLWTFVASRVIVGVAEAPLKGIAYSIGFSIGIYLGSRIESYIAMGQVLIQAIIGEEHSAQITSSLREKGFAVTTIDAHGRDSAKTVLMIFANRKGKEGIISEIHMLDESAMIITNDITALQGGTISTVRKMLR